MNIKYDTSHAGTLETPITVRVHRETKVYSSRYKYEEKIGEIGFILPEFAILPEGDHRAGVQPIRCCEYEEIEQPPLKIGVR